MYDNVYFSAVNFQILNITVALSAVHSGDLAANEEVLLQSTLVEQPLLGEGSNYTGIRRIQEHFVKQGEDATLPKAVAAIHQFICSTLSSKSM